MSEEHILYEGDKHWVLKPKAMNETGFPVIVSDEGGDVTIEKSTDLLARQQAAKDTDGNIKYTPPICPSCGVTYQNHFGLIGTCEKLQKIFALVEAHYEEAYYRRTTADKKLWQAVLGLKDSTGI